MAKINGKEYDLMNEKQQTEYENKFHFPKFTKYQTLKSKPYLLWNINTKNKIIDLLEKNLMFVKLNTKIISN